jgi:GDP-D-mannose dehydratase
MRLEKMKKTGEIIIKINPRYFRPTEVDLLIGDPTKAKEELGWESKNKNFLILLNNDQIWTILLLKKEKKIFI